MRIFKLSQVLVSSLCLSMNVAAYAAYGIAGVIDKAGRTVVPCVYHRVDYLGQGFFFAHQLNREHPLRDSNKGIIFNYSGQPVPVRVPSGSSLAGVFLPVEEVKTTATKQPSTKYLPTKELPKGSVLKIATTSGFGLCKPNGELVLPAEFGFISAPNDGCYPVWTGTPGLNMHLQFIFNSNTGKRIPIAKDTRVSIIDFPNGSLLPFTEGFEGNKAGYMARTGEIVIPAKFAEARAFAANGLAVVAFERDGQQVYINTNGKVVSPLYKKAGDFVNNYAVVEKTNNIEGEKCLVNAKFQAVLGPYREIVPLKKNVFAVCENPETGYKVIDATGKLLCKLPRDVNYIRPLENGIIMGASKAVDDNSKFTFVDSSGKLLSSFSQKVFPESSFGLTTVLKEMPNQMFLVGVDDIYGNVVLPPQSCNLNIITGDRFSIYRSDTHFHKAIWRDPNIDNFGFGGLNRAEIFCEFLQDFDLIGMSRERVVELLGQTENSSNIWEYHLLRAPCTVSGESIEFDFKDDKVVAWRKVVISELARSPGPWITTNMIFQSNSSSPLIAKSRVQ